MAKKNQASLSKTEKSPNQKKSKIGYDWIRVVLGILILSVLLVVSLDMINGKFAEKQDELIEEKESDWGWIVITAGYTVPLVLTCAVPVAMCAFSKRDAQRKHLIKALIIAGSILIVICIVCPVQISGLLLEKEFCELMEQKADEQDDFMYPEELPSVEEVTLKLQRAVEWTAKAGLGLAVVGTYQGVRYKKLRDGEADEEIPPEETSDELPDVNWVER